MKKELEFLCKAVCLAMVYFCATALYAAPATPSSETIYILLGTSRDGQDTSDWRGTGIKSYIQNSVLGAAGDTSLVYESSYDLSMGTPADFAREYLSRLSTTSILDSAQRKWFTKSKASAVVKLRSKYSNNLSSLKSARPDLVPSHFVIIADGASGLAVREYIQGPDYQGEISNVIFFNTPHEGMGLADQGVFNHTKKLDRDSDNSKYAMLVTLALAAYIVGGTEGLQDMMIGLLKDAVMGMAYNVGAISGGVSNLYGGYAADQASSWYLAQDADEDDPKYKDLVKTNGVDSLLGSTQILNLGSVRGGYAHPRYNVVYSYGLPTVGNGRRTLDDFAERSKFHVSKKKLARVLADSLRSAFGASAQENLDGLAADILENNNVRAALANYSQYSGKVADAARALAAVSELRRDGLNKDDIPGTVYKLLRIVDTFVPDSYKSEIYSLLMKYFSPEVQDVIGNVGKCAIGGGSASACARKGMSLMAANLANYSLNFFDEGTFDVPYYSAMGENVAAFKSAGAERHGYSLQDLLDTKNLDRSKFTAYSSALGELNEYNDLLSDVGELETDRLAVDLALNVACEVITRANAAYGKICSAAEFATNVTLVGLTSSKVKKLASTSDALKVSRKMAPMASVSHENAYSGKDYHGNDFSGSVPDIEDMLFGYPLLSIATVRNVNANGDTVAVPLISKNECSSGDVYDWSTFDSLCGDPGWMTMGLLDFSEDAGTLHAAQEDIRVKDVAYGGGGTARAKYAPLRNLSIDNVPMEFRFQVDDLQPDSLRWIKIDFNTRNQIIYERSASGQWYVYFEESYKAGVPVDTLSASPVTPEGLFVFRPDAVIKAYNAYVDKNGGNRYEIAGLVEDGVNVFYFAVMNKVGKVSSSKLSMMMLLTQPKYDEVWPRNLARVSRLDTVLASVNNLNNNHLNLTSARLKVSKISDDGGTLDSLIATVALDSAYQTPEATSKKWNISADVGPFVAGFGSHSDGEYMLEWDFDLHDAISGKTDTLKMRTLVYLDVTPPALSLDVHKETLTGRKSDGAWATVVSPDSGYEAVRGMRGMLVDGLGNVYSLFNKTRHNARYFDIRWDTTRVAPSPGRYGLVIQAYDFADPDSVSLNRLLNIDDSDIAAWRFVAVSDTGFKPGFNGIVLRDSIWIDNAAPSVVPGSIVAGSVRDTTASGCDSSRITRAALVLNSCNLLSTSFRVNEELFGRVTSPVKVEIVFRDSAGHVRTYPGVLEADTAVSDFAFVEPYANKLSDGVYSVYAIMSDLAGNVSETEIVSKVVVDRTAPAVYDVSSGGGAFDSAAVLVGKEMSALVSQNVDDPRNVSTLSCVRSLNAAGVSSGWKNADSLTFASETVKRRLPFSIDDLVRGMPDGSWTVYIGCYDAAGNFGSGLDFFGVGARYPRITYPDTSLNSFYYGKVLVKGETPNPVLIGNDNMVSFKLAWKADGDTAWHDDDNDFEYLTHGVGAKERDLAIWTLDSVPSGDDTLRLSVRACDTCAWVSSKTVVTVYSRLDPLHDTTETDIRITVPSVQTLGRPGSIAIELEHVSDTTAWEVDSRIFMRIIGDTTVVEASRKSFNPATVSPFKMVPTTIDSGLYVWQDASYAWHVYWKGSVKGAVIDTAYLRQKRDNVAPVPVPNSAERTAPRLTLRYLADSTNTTLSDSLFSLAARDTGAMGSVEAGGIVVPAYDRSATWALDSLGDDSLHLVFASGSAFTVDVSSVDSAYRNVYCGNRPADEALPDYGGVGTVYVHPHRYTMYHVWSGLNDGGIIADGDSAYAKVIAYSKNDPSRIVTKEIGWELAHDKIELVSGTAPGGELYFNMEFNNTADSTPVKREEIRFQYGLLGRSAYVTEEVIGPNGFVKLIKELKLVHAGASNTANSVSWNGEDGQGLVASGLGTYKFRITAYSDAAGTKLADVLEYPFELKSRENLREAPFVASDSVNYPAVLTMDEAHLDSFGGLRYVGSIDYLMKAHAELNRLPEEDRTINYKWEPWTNNNGTAMQAPAFYERFRYSVGIHRHRDKFPVTVAVLLVAEGFDVEDKIDPVGVVIDFILIGSNERHYCSKGSVKHPYRIQLLQATMSESGTISYSGDIKLNSGLDIVGYSKNNPSEISMGVAVKVFPKDVFDMIKGEMNGHEIKTGYLEDDLNDGMSIGNMTSLWNGDLYKPGANVWQWFNNWNGKPVLWESKRNSFSHNQTAIRMSSMSGLGSSPCTVDTTVINSVCGISNETESDPGLFTAALKIDNPHANMMYVDVDVMPGESDYGVNKFSGSKACSKYDGSYSNIGIHLDFSVTPAYWNPALDPNKKWGYTNLANRYVRFDPTNIKLFGDGGYFKTNQDDGGEKNYFGSKGWEYHYDTLGARISAFEAMRYPMSKSPMNPLIFADEVHVANDSMSLSNFSITYFNAGVYPKFRTVASNANGTVNMKTVDNTSSTAMAETWIDNGCKYNPLKVRFTVAPVMTAGEAIIQSENNFWLDYPFTGVLSDTLLKRDPNYGAQPSRYVFYTDLRSRVHTGVGDWDDSDWDRAYLRNDTIINPVSVGISPAPVPLSNYTRNYMDSVYSYSVKPSDTAAGVWSVNPDSLEQIPASTFRHGTGGPMTHGYLKPIVVDSFGNPFPNTRWIAYPSGGLWSMTNGGDSLQFPLRYVFSADSSIAMNMNTREHSVPLANVFRQNSLDTVLGDAWVKNLSVRLDSIVERDTALVDTALRKHDLLDATYNDATRFFNVVWNGMAPTSRASEIATFRGRVPGANAPWKLSYVHDGYTYPVASGVQDTVPISEPFPVLKRFNMNHLNGNASFFLTWGSDGITYYRKLDLRVGTRVEPDSFTYVQSAYANAGVEFAAHAWGDVPVDVNVRSVAPDEYVFKTFKGLAVQGPVVEVLPSHDFGDDNSLWPVVKVKLSHDDVRNSGYKLDELKIYKPDFENREIVPLENVSYECFVEVSGGIDTRDSCDNTTWDYVFLKGTTRTFSSFVVLDTLTAKSVVPSVPPSVPDTLICAEPASDTVWAGTYNGRLEFANPCTGRANYLLQLRVGGSVAAEHQGVLSGPSIAWEARRGDIWLPADVYTSRADYYGVDGSTERVRGPMVRVDSMPPSLTDFDVSVLDGDSGSRVLLVSASLADSISGIANVVMDVRFGGYLAETRTLSLGSIADTALYEQFVLSSVLLHHCTGCRATVDVRIEDMGHNYVEESWRSRQLYPFPSSLALWYPMSEGSGNVAHEMLAGLNLPLGNVTTPWAYGGRLSLLDSGDRSLADILHVDSVTPVSVEFDAIVGAGGGVIFTWYGDSSMLTIGIENGRFYVDAGYGTVTLSHPVGSRVSEHCVFVLDTSFVTLYIDGIFIERKTLPGGFVLRGNGRPALGRQLGGQVSAYFRMSDLRIYRSALTAEQVQFLQNLDSLPPYREPGDTSAVDTSVVDSTPVQLAVRTVELDSVSGLVVDQSCALPGRSYLRQGSGTSGMAVWNVDAPRAGNYALYVFGRGYPSASSRVEVSVNGVDVGTYGLRPSGLWESSRMGDSLLFALDSGMNRIALRPLGGAELAGVAAISGPTLPEAHLVDYGQSGWAAPEPSVEAFIYYENAYETTWARPRIKLHNLTGQYIYGARIRYYYSGEGSAVAAESWYPKGPVSLVHDAGDVYYAEYALAEPILPHGYANNGSAIQIGLHRTPDYKPWKIQDDPSYEHGSAYGYVEAKGVVVLNSRGEMLNGWNCVDDGMPATTPASGIRAIAADESNEPWKYGTLAVSVENNGSDSISNFEVRYYYRDATGTMEPPDWYYLGPENKAAIPSKVAAGGNLYYVSLVYNNVVLKPGKHTNAVKFGLHAQGWSESAYSASDDPSHHGIGTGQNLLVADSVVVLDLNGNLLWGKVPRPNFQNNVVASDSGANRVTRVGDMVYVNIDQTGYYYLEVVDAFGTVKNRIFEGTWNVGEHTVQIPASAMKAGRYIVLRRGNTILNWQLLK